MSALQVLSRHALASQACILVRMTTLLQPVTSTNIYTHYNSIQVYCIFHENRVPVVPNIVLVYRTVLTELYESQNRAIVGALLIELNKYRRATVATTLALQ